jgi:hypothetical protein
VRRWLAAGGALALASAFEGSASAERILGAGRDTIALRWAPASGPVALYEVTCTVDGVPGVLVGTSSEPRLEIARDASRWGQTFESCVAQGFDAAGNAGPPSEPSGERFEFLADTDLNGDGIVGSPDTVRLRFALLRGYRDASFVWSMRRALGCRVDPVARVYFDCPEPATPTP